LLEVTGETVKLTDTADENVREHYFTLSYVWGNPTPPLMSTPEKEGELRAGLPIIRLEKTYRDALHVTKALGYRYLWIDLFCIFQGESAKGKQDWAQESPTMDQVYTHGLLNISATYASHGDGGCFTQVGDDDIIATPLCVSWAMTEGDPMSYHLLHLGYRRDRQKNALLDFENNSPVFTRGWTLQECMLATRVLHFAAKGIVWECCEGRAMHFSPFLPNNIKLSDRLGPCAGSIAADSSTHLTNLWLRALYTYTRTNLTQPNKDKLIAVLGIGKRISKTLGDTLWHGFLACTLPYSLCWYAACNLDKMRETCEVAVNDSFQSWHFARSNHRLKFVRIRGAEPLLRIWDAPTDSDRLCYCIGKVVPLQVPLDINRPLRKLSPHSLILFRFVVEAGGARLTSSYVSDAGGERYRDSWEGTKVGLGHFEVRLDHPHVYESNLKLSWLLLPVCWRTVRRSSYRDSGIRRSSHRDSGIRGFTGLLLRARSNGELVQVGLLYNMAHLMRDDLAAMLEAVRKAKPRLLVIS
jgi:hypothetical protein